MYLSFDNITNNPVIVAGTALMAAAGLVTIISLGILLAALLHNPDVNLQITVNETTANTVNPGEIGQRNFFGLALAEPTISIEDLPETKLELTLRGAFAVRRPVRGLRVIVFDDVMTTGATAAAAASALKAAGAQHVRVWTCARAAPGTRPT